MHSSRSLHLTGFSLLAALAGVVHGQLPTAIPGLQVWLDGQDSGTLQTSGGTVFQWDDKSGNGFHAVQANAARQPSTAGTLNGFQAVHLDSAALNGDPNGDGMSITGVNIGARGYTVYLVDQYWGDVGGGRSLQGTGGNNWLLGSWGCCGTGIRSGHYAEGWVASVNGFGTGLNQPRVSQALGGTGASSLLWNGDLLGRNGANGNPGGLQIGWHGGVGGFDETGKMDVGEVIAFNRLLTDPERRTMDNYLSTHWNLPRAMQRHFPTQTARVSGGDAGDGLDFTGNFVAAVNAGGPAVTVGNANFVASAPGGAINSQNVVGPGFWGTWNMGASADDTALGNVMNSIQWSGDGGAPAVSSTVTGLIPGHAYKAQLIFAEECCANRHFGVQINGETVVQDLQVSNLQQGNLTGGGTKTAGTAVVHAWRNVAGSNFSFNLIAPDLAGGDLNPTIAGYTLEDMGMVTTSAGGITSVASLDLAGSFAYALDFGNSVGNAPGPKTVAGLTFSPAELASGVFTYAENILNYTHTEIGGTADDNNLEDILQSIRWTATDDLEEVVTMDLDVVPGTQYKLQLLFGDDASGNRGFDISVEDMLLYDNFRTADYGGSTAYVSYEFTASDDELNIMLDGWRTAFADKNPIISGLTLEVIPEPSAASVSLLAAALLGFRRRR